MNAQTQLVLENTKPGETLIKASGLTIHYPLQREHLFAKQRYVHAVDNIDLEVAKGSAFGLVGESGSGKTTAALGMVRLTPISAGKIILKGRDITHIEGEELRYVRRHMQVVFQDPFSSLSPRLNIEQIISEGLKVHNIGKDKKDRQRMVFKTLQEVGLNEEMAGRYPHEFSGGQRQRIAIARAIALQPKFIMLDEPTSALDMTIQAQIIKLLKDLQTRYGITYLFVSHDLRVIRAMADEVAVMQNGKIVEAGPAADLFNNPQHPYTKSLFAAAFELKTKIQ